MSILFSLRTYGCMPPPFLPGPKTSTTKTRSEDGAREQQTFESPVRSNSDEARTDGSKETATFQKKLLQPAFSLVGPHDLCDSGMRR